MKRFLLIAVLLFISSNNLEAKQANDVCSEFKYGQKVLSNIGRPGKIIKCGSLFPNPVYGYGIEVKWDDETTDKMSWFYLEDVHKELTIISD